MTTLKKQDFIVYNDKENLLQKSSSSGSFSSNSDLSVESQLFNDNNLFFSPVSGSTGTATCSPLYDRSIKTLRSKLSSLSNNSLADITNTSHNSHFSHISNNSIDLTSNRSSITAEQKRMHILGRLNKRNSINSSTPYFYQYKCKSVVSSPLPTVEDDEIYYVNKNVENSQIPHISQSSQKSQVPQNNQNNQNIQNIQNDTHDKTAQHSNSGSPNSNSYGIASGSNNYGDGSDSSDGSDSGNNSFNNSNNKSDSSKSHDDSTLSASTIASQDITTSSSENNNTSLFIRNLQRNSVSIFNESTVSQSPQQNRYSKNSRFSQQTINTVDFLHNRIDEIKESSYSLPILENDENDENVDVENDPIFTIYKHNNFKNKNTTSQLNLKIANHSTSSMINPNNKRHASLPALVDITSYSEKSNTNNISDDSNISNSSKDNLLQNSASIIYTNTPIKKCPNKIIYFLLLASLLAPPFYMVIATGLADSVFGRFPRRVKILSTVLFTIFLLGAILGIAVGLGLGLT